MRHLARHLSFTALLLGSLSTQVFSCSVDESLVTLCTSLDFEEDRGSFSRELDSRGVTVIDTVAYDSWDGDKSSSYTEYEDRLNPLFLGILEQREQVVLWEGNDGMTYVSFLNEKAVRQSEAKFSGNWSTVDIVSNSLSNYDSSDLFDAVR